MDFDADLSAGQPLDVDFVARASGDQPGTATFFIEGTHETPFSYNKIIIYKYTVYT